MSVDVDERLLAFKAVAVIGYLLSPLILATYGGEC
jgi:hypothetical protein